MSVASADLELDWAQNNGPQNLQERRMAGEFLAEMSTKGRWASGRANS